MKTRRRGKCTGKIKKKKVHLNKMMARYLYTAFLISNTKRQTSVGAGFPGWQSSTTVSSSRGIRSLKSCTMVYRNALTCFIVKVF